MVFNLLLFALGLLGLWFGADRVVNGGKVIAQRLHVSQVLIGLTIVSIGTSLPEIAVSALSGMQGASDIAVGSMVGSCLAQITLILGIAGLIQNISVREQAIKMDGAMLLVAIALFAFFLWTDYEMYPWEGGLLMGLYGLYILYSIKHEALRSQARDRIFHLVVHDPPMRFPLWVRFLEMGLGIGIVVYSSSLVLDNALVMARATGLSESFIGVMIVGVATGLPELSTAIVGYLKKAQGLSIGSLIGSNVTDPMFSIGVGALFGGFKTDSALLFFDIPFWFIATGIALLLLFDQTIKLTKNESVALIAVYVIFVMTKVVMA